VAWIRNNWRPDSNIHETRANVIVNPLNLIWEIQREDVEEELRNILGVEELDNHDPGYFQQRNAAAKRVINGMSQRDRIEFNNILKDRKSKGNPEPVRRE
jgi:hypothetical protein